MQPGVLITDGGQHSAEKWAVTTAEMLTPLDDKLDGARLIAAQKLRTAIAEALVPHHGTVQTKERAHLAKDAAARLNAGPDPSPYLDEAWGAITAVAKGTPWESHFAKPDVERAARGLLANHFATVQHIEHSWHADRNPHLPASKAFRDRHHGQGA